MKNQPMYRLAATIPNDMALNLIPEIAFHPDGSLFAVSHQQANEVVVYDAQNRNVVRVFRNPDAGLDNPHAVLISHHFLVVSNTHGVARPSSICVYRLDDACDRPIGTIVTPFPHLREAHSFVLRNGVLAVTYCESVEGPGAVVTYRFDAESGRIGEATTIRESCFLAYGEPKGLAFSRNGSELFVTYVTQKRQTGTARFARRVNAVRRVLRGRSLPETLRFIRLKAKRWLAQTRKPESAPTNGIAVFSVDCNGDLSESPTRILVRNHFCRLENIDIVGDTAVLSDTINGKVYLHDLLVDPQLNAPTEEISEGVTLPHGAKLSPDGSMLVVTNYGLKVENEIIHWMTPAENSTNAVLVYDRCA